MADPAPDRDGHVGGPKVLVTSAYTDPEPNSTFKDLISNDRFGPHRTARDLRALEAPGLVTGEAFLAFSPKRIDTSDGVVITTEHNAFDFACVARHVRAIGDTRRVVRG